MDLSQSQVVGEASRESIGEEDDLTELSEQEEEVGRRREPEAQTAVTPMPRGAAGAAAMARATEGATPQGAMAATGAEAVERLAPAPPEPGLQPLQAPPGSLIFRKGSEAPDLPGEASHQARPPNRSNSVAAAAAAAAAARRRPIGCLHKLHASTRGCTHRCRDTAIRLAPAAAAAAGAATAAAIENSGM
mmetsp:Transcript_3871/g.8969  ORF Transcript_3871/g.8969 Transcript_3871/m.8969 type:complete len:190 (+) Transcript_3871:394-963(+)